MSQRDDRLAQQWPSGFGGTALGAYTPEAMRHGLIERRLEAASGSPDR